MNERTFLKLKLISWIEELTRGEIDQLIKDTQKCAELDRCFRYCIDVDCNYYSLLLLLRTPNDNYRYHLIEWIKTVDEDDLKSLLETGVVCGEQSFCVRYCASTNCLFKKLITYICDLSSFKV